jgi:DNA polymerase-3 subunit chi
MTRIDFYILPEPTQANGDTVMTVCRLCEKAAASGARVYLRVPQPQLADQIDSALWSYKEGGFLSHEIDTGKPSADPQPVILIGNGEPPETHHGILFNLGADVPLYFSRFDRVLEIVPATVADRSSSRERYKFYRDRGYELKTNNL